MVILVWESDAGVVGSSVCDDEGNCERTVFTAAGGITDSDLGDELGGGVGTWASGAVVRFGGVVVDGAGGERVGVFVGMDERVSEFVAGSVGVFVCQI